MTTSVATDVPLRKALRSCVEALQRIADYQLDPALDKRMLEMGEGKEFLDEEQHAELLALIDFTERRTIEKLAAQLALKQLRDAVPDLDWPKP